MSAPFWQITWPQLIKTPFHQKCLNWREADKEKSKKHGNNLFDIFCIYLKSWIFQMNLRCIFIQLLISFFTRWKRTIEFTNADAEWPYLPFRTSCSKCSDRNWMCNFLPFQEIMTDRPARRGGPTDQPTDGHESSWGCYNFQCQL